MNKINTFFNWCYAQPKKLLAHCYILVVAIFVLSTVLASVFNVAAYKMGFYQEKNLNIHDFEHVGVEVVDDMTMINATNDTQLIYAGNIKNVYVKCEFSLDPGEFVAFYSKNKDYAFGMHQIVYAKQEGDYYVFRFPLGTEHVRIDTGVEPSVTVKFDEILLNKTSFRDITGVSTGQFFYIMILPLLFFSIVYSLSEIAVLKKGKKLTMYSTNK